MLGLIVNVVRLVIFLIRHRPSSSGPGVQLWSDVLDSGRTFVVRRFFKNSPSGLDIGSAGPMAGRQAGTQQTNGRRGGAS